MRNRSNKESEHRQVLLARRRSPCRSPARPPIRRRTTDEENCTASERESTGNRNEMTLVETSNQIKIFCRASPQSKLSSLALRFLLRRGGGGDGCSFSVPFLFIIHFSAFFSLLMVLFSSLCLLLVCLHFSHTPRRPLRLHPAHLKPCQHKQRLGQHRSELLFCRFANGTYPVRKMEIACHTIPKKTFSDAYYRP